MLVDFLQVFITEENALLEALKVALHALWAPSRCSFQLNQVRYLHTYYSHVKQYELNKLQLRMHATVALRFCAMRLVPQRL